MSFQGIIGGAGEFTRLIGNIEIAIPFYLYGLGFL
jgi:hypothetical protein